MCGIIGYIGKKKVKLEQLLENAVFNSHRGNDGVGMIFFDEEGSIQINKYLYKLEEIYKRELNKEIFKKTKEGSFEYETFDKGTYDKSNKKFNKNMDNLLKQEIKIGFIHHRKATYGADTLENLHPIEYNDKYYIHNGSAYGMESVKSYIEVMLGIVFKSETDTEVIAILYNELMKKYKNDKNKVFETLQQMFPEGWGVLIEIDKSRNITIIKDEIRDLWVFKKYSDGIVITSEPTPYIKDFDKVIKLDIGIFKLNMDIKGDDYTEHTKKSFKWWKDVHDSAIEIEKCEVCGKAKPCLSTFLCEGHPQENERNKLCYECFCLNVVKVDYDEDKQKQDNKKNVIKTYLGSMVN